SSLGPRRLAREALQQVDPSLRHAALVRGRLELLERKTKVTPPAQLVLGRRIKRAKGVDRGARGLQRLKLERALQQQRDGGGVVGDRAGEPCECFIEPAVLHKSPDCLFLVDRRRLLLRHDCPDEGLIRVLSNEKGRCNLCGELWPLRNRRDAVQ